MKFSGRNFKNEFFVPLFKKCDFKQQNFKNCYFKQHFFRHIELVSASYKTQQRKNRAWLYMRDFFQPADSRTGKPDCEAGR
jgi:uncharacterized protein YjbI with pentapeptide repeats